MPKISRKPLKQNPFTSYRDPVTGRWVVVHQTEAEEFVPPQVQVPALYHPEALRLPVSAEAVLVGSGR